MSATLKKIIGGIFIVFFVFAAAVQLNDVDPALWVFLYVVAAVVALLFALNRLKFWWAITLAVIYGILAVYHWPPEFEGVALQDGMKTMNIELGRESLGMGICAIVTLILGFLSKK